MKYAFEEMATSLKGGGIKGGHNYSEEEKPWGSCQMKWEFEEQQEKKKKTSLKSLNYNVQRSGNKR